MSDASRTGVSTETMPATPDGAVGGLPASVGHGLTEPGTRCMQPPKSAAEEIADDAAKVTLFGALISRASTGSDVRFEKVAALRQKIEAGTYGVAAEDVAHKMVREMQKK